MIRIAVIGDIGSGKSYAAKSFGQPLFDADLEVAKIYKYNRLCFIKLKKVFPKYFSSFPIKKNEIVETIMADRSNLKKITKVVHPEVKKRMNNFLNKQKRKKIIILDVPLFLENKFDKKNDILVFVDAQKNKILNRLKKRKNFNLKLIKKLKKIQLPLEYKKRKSHYIIKNNFNNKSMKKSVKIILNKIL